MPKLLWFGMCDSELPEESISAIIVDYSPGGTGGHRGKGRSFRRGGVSLRENRFCFFRHDWN